MYTEFDMILDVKYPAVFFAPHGGLLPRQGMGTFNVQIDQRLHHSILETRRVSLDCILFKTAS